MNTPEHSAGPKAGASALPGASRAVWLKNLHQWHWISSAMCLMAMLLFSITGFTLNHAAQIEAKPQVTRQKAAVPPALSAALRAFAEAHPDSKAPLPPKLAKWAEKTFPVNVSGKAAEWSEEDAYVAQPEKTGRVRTSEWDSFMETL
jgi:hypothetical protein